MAKNSIDAYGALGKSNVLFFDPDDLHLVTDPNHALYDERVNLPLDEAMVLNIMCLGVIEPIIVFKCQESGRVLVAAGRQRVKNAREANKRLRERGAEPIRVPGLPRRDSALDLAGIMVSENELRTSDSPLGRAEKMTRLMRLGKGEDELAMLFGCSVRTVQQTMALLDTTADVRRAVQSGQINVTHAHKIAKLSPEQQREKVKAVVEAAQGKTGHEAARAKRAAIAPDATRMRGRKDIQNALEATQGDVKQALLWVLGQVESLPAGALTGGAA